MRLFVCEIRFLFMLLLRRKKYYMCDLCERLQIECVREIVCICMER